MLLPASIYRRIPQIWALMGVLFLLSGLMAGPDFWYFYPYLLLGVISLGRSVWLHVARQRITRRREVTVLTETQKLVQKR